MKDQQISSLKKQLEEERKKVYGRGMSSSFTALNSEMCVLMVGVSMGNSRRRLRSLHSLPAACLRFENERRNLSERFTKYELREECASFPHSRSKKVCAQLAEKDGLNAEAQEEQTALAAQVEALKKQV